MTRPADTYWELFDHVADVGVRGAAPTLAGALAQAALALTAVACDPATVAPRQAVAITCAAPDPELLLVDWLNALLYRMAVDHLLFSRHEVAVQRQGAEWRLTATAWGEPVDPARHALNVEVKAATYAQLQVGEHPPGHWRAQCIVDV